MVDLIAKFIIGGSCVAGVTFLVQKGVPEYAGIVMTFPIITMVSLLVIKENDLVPLSKAGLVGLVSAMIFLFIFMLSYKIFQNRYIAVIISSVIWVFFTAVFFYLKKI